MVTIKNNENTSDCPFFIVKIPCDTVGQPILLKFIPKYPLINAKGKNIVLTIVKVSIDFFDYFVIFYYYNHPLNLDH